MSKADIFHRLANNAPNNETLLPLSFDSDPDDVLTLTTWSKVEALVTITVAEFSDADAAPPIGG